MTKSIIDWIDVGEVSAERDANLDKYFYDAGVTKKIVLNKQQFLILGRKGAGKTAVYLHLISKPTSIFDKNDIVVGLSLQSYKWQSHYILGNMQNAGGFQHTNSWKFVICVEAIRAVVNHLDINGCEIPGEIKKASSVLNKLFSNPIPSWTDLLGEKLFKLASFKLPNLSAGAEEELLALEGGEISFEEISANSSLKTQLNNNIETLTSWLESCLEKCPKELRVFLVFDRLDEAWVTNFFEESKQIVSGLLNASEYILNKFDGLVRPIVFLREDIFSTLDLNDRNKLKEDCSESLKWSQDEIEKLILKRVNYYASLNGGLAISSIQDIFLEKEMRSRTTPVKHIYNRTMGRPRDMVSFLSRIIETAKSQLDDELEGDSENASYVSGDGSKILSKAIYVAEPGYSEYLYGELDDEWRTQNQNFQDYLTILENLRYASISSDELADELKNKNIVSDRAEFRQIVRFLFDNSIIGIQVGGSQQWRYRCFYPNKGFLDTDVIKVHPGLIKRLGLTEGASEKATAITNTQNK
jgi:hypothetical protein